jgi:hypothetical protein
MLQLPVAIIRIREPHSGTSELVMEFINSVDYDKISYFLNIFAHQQVTTSPSLTRSDLNDLLCIAQSNREREIIRCTAFKASGFSSTAAKRKLGIENMSKRLSNIEKCVSEIKKVYECVEDIVRAEKIAVFKSNGLYEDSDVAESSEQDYSNASDHNEGDDFIDLESHYNTLKTCEFNWFDFAEVMNNKLELEQYYSVVMSSNIPDSEKCIVEQSHSAFILDCQLATSADRQARALNGEVVSDSEHEDPDVYLKIVNDLNSSDTCNLVARKRKQIRRRAKYLRSKFIAKRNFLSRKSSKTVKGILKDHPDIGSVMEKFVEERNIGADAWRRTGVLTFDGNTNVKQKVTYERIRQHLMSYYNKHFSYGTVVQLCVARNMRRASANRYKGVAKITSRRARKGFQLKYNPDSHWSSAFYRGLNQLQYTDGQNIININRDDAAGFRLDTMCTHRLHKTPMVRG